MNIPKEPPTKKSEKKELAKPNLEMGEGNSGPSTKSLAQLGKQEEKRK